MEGDEVGDGQPDAWEEGDGDVEKGPLPTCIITPTTKEADNDDPRPKPLQQFNSDSSKGNTTEGHNENGKKRAKEDKPPSKVVVRRLPPSMTKETFLQQVSPLPPVDYIYFVAADPSMGPHAFSRVYLNFINQEDLFAFTQTFDNYVFLDAKGLEYPAVVEFAPFQRVPRSRPNKKKDPLVGTIELDPVFIAFKENIMAEAIENSKGGAKTVKQHYFETEINTTEEVSTTPLLEFLKQKRAEKARIKEERREEKRKKEAERKLKQKTKEKKPDGVEEEEKEVKANDESPPVVTAQGAQLQSQYLKQILGLSGGEGGKGSSNESSPPLKRSEIVIDKALSTENLLPSAFPNSVKSSTKHLILSKDKEPKGGNFKKKDRDDRPPKENRGRDFKRNGKYLEDRHKQVDRKEDTKRKVSNEEGGQGGEGAAGATEEEKPLREKHSERNKKGGESVKKGIKGEEGVEGKKRSRYEKAHSKREARSLKRLEEFVHRKKGLDKKEQEKKKGKSGKVGSEVKEEEKESPKRRNSLEAVRVSVKEDSEVKRCSSLGRDEGNNESKEPSKEVAHGDKAVQKREAKGGKDPRTERRIRNKDRPSLEIYRPGMGKFSKQRLEKEKTLGSSTEFDSPSHSPSPPAHVTSEPPLPPTQNKPPQNE